MENLAAIAFETNANILTDLLPNLATDTAISKQPVKSQERSKSRPISHVENANQKKLLQPKKTETRKSIAKKTE